MSSFPARMAKRALKAAGCTREWLKPKGRDEAFPHRVLNRKGEPIGLTWAQSTHPIKRGRAELKRKPSKPRKAISRQERKAIHKARVSLAGIVKPSRVRGFKGHCHEADRSLPAPIANLSRHHPDYGCTPAQHAHRKAKRP